MAEAAEALEGGFTEPVLNAQTAFRALMDAMARPARPVNVPDLATPPEPLTKLAGAVACTLIDADTPVWLDNRLSASEAVRAWLRFHAGARFAEKPVEAAFALVGDPSSMPSLCVFAQGTQEYPDRSATLILAVESLDGGEPMIFRGPGIDGPMAIAPRGLPAGFVRQWTENAARFPRGVDLMLTAGDRLACLPRSAQLVPAED